MDSNQACETSTREALAASAEGGSDPIASRGKPQLVCAGLVSGGFCGRLVVERAHHCRPQPEWPEVERRRLPIGAKGKKA